MDKIIRCVVGGCGGLVLSMFIVGVMKGEANAMDGALLGIVAECLFYEAFRPAK